jgi:hypothetical protein
MLGDILIYLSVYASLSFGFSFALLYLHYQSENHRTSPGFYSRTFRFAFFAFLTLDNTVIDDLSNLYPIFQALTYFAMSFSIFWAAAVAFMSFQFIKEQDIILKKSFILSFLLV